MEDLAAIATAGAVVVAAAEAVAVSADYAEGWLLELESGEVCGYTESAVLRDGAGAVSDGFESGEFAKVPVK